MNDANEQPNDPALASVSGSAAQHGYSRGYAAGTRRVQALEAEIMSLRKLATPQPPEPLPESQEVTIEYLIATAEAMTGAAKLLLAMRKPQNDKSSHSRE